MAFLKPCGALGGVEPVPAAEAQVRVQQAGTGEALGKDQRFSWGFFGLVSVVFPNVLDVVLVGLWVILVCFCKVW